jgi:ABC-2 type transport system ATP-binding protein
MGECEARTQGAPIVVLSGRPRTQHRAAQRVPATQPCFVKPSYEGRGPAHRFIPATGREFGGTADVPAGERCDAGDMKTVIETQSLTKRFGGRAAVDNVDLVVPAGVAFGFLGPNGAGKTTMIRTLLGLTEPTAGKISLLGLPLPARRSEALARVGAIVEEPRFHAHLTGRENLRVAAAARSKDADGRIDDALARVGLANRAGDRVKSYSLGMRQRLGIARALLGDPTLLILDEPMNGLDPAGILEMRHLIRSFVDEGRTVFLSSHLLDEVEKTADEVAIVDQGRIIVQGPTAQIASGGEPTLLVEVDDASAARRALSTISDVRSVSPVARGGRSFVCASPVLSPSTSRCS